MHVIPVHQVNCQLSIDREGPERERQLEKKKRNKRGRSKTWCFSRYRAKLAYAGGQSQPWR